jgi:succinate dehydrogenase cytochrome b subunit
MTRLLGFLGSSVGKKLVMAVSGAILLLFVIGHMLGNLQVYLGPRALDHYAVFLREFGHGGGIWVARAVILLAFLAHLWGALFTSLESWRARPAGYRVFRPAGGGSTLSSRSMRWTGVVILAFVLYHLADMTFGLSVVHPGFVEGRVFHNFVVSFLSVPKSIFYVLAMLALGLHMLHGGWSFLQTLGISHVRYNHLRYALALIVALIVVLANVSFPTAVLTGVVKEAPQTAASTPAR